MSRIENKRGFPKKKLFQKVRGFERGFFLLNDKKFRKWPIPINDTQIPPQTPPPSKVAKLGFKDAQCFTQCQPVKKQFSDFYFLRNSLFCTQNS